MNDRELPMITFPLTSSPVAIVDVAVPLTVNVPNILTFPLELILPLPKTVNRVVVPIPADVEDAIVNIGFVPERPDESCIANFEEGVDEPTPMLPLDRIARALFAALVKNSAIFPTPLCKIFKNVAALEVAFCISFRKNDVEAMPDKVLAEIATVEVPAVTAYVEVAAMKAAGTAPMILRGVISPSQSSGTIEAAVPPTSILR